jgi:hypothetical protein
MLDLAQIRRDLGEAVDDLPVQCVIGGQAFNATSSEDGGERLVDMDGMEIDADRTVIADATAVPTLAGNDRITVAGKEYRVQNAIYHQDGIGVELRLKAVAR